jgi:hypothetical protein
VAWEQNPDALRAELVATCNANAAGKDQEHSIDLKDWRAACSPVELLKMDEYEAEWF